MHQAANLQFERMMDELVLWQAIPEGERSPAPAWWWGPAMAVLDAHEPMPHAWCSELGLSQDSSFAEGAHALLALFAKQTSPPLQPEPDHATTAAAALRLKSAVV